MGKSWTPEELAAASAAMKAAGHMSYEEFCAAPRLRLEYRGAMGAMRDGEPPRLPVCGLAMRRVSD